MIQPLSYDLTHTHTYVDSYDPQHTHTDTHTPHTHTHSTYHVFTYVLSEKIPEKLATVVSHLRGRKGKRVLENRDGWAIFIS